MCCSHLLPAPDVVTMVQHFFLLAMAHVLINSSTNYLHDVSYVCVCYIGPQLVLVPPCGMVHVNNNIPTHDIAIFL